MRGTEQQRQLGLLPDSGPLTRAPTAPPTSSRIAHLTCFLGCTSQRDCDYEARLAASGNLVDGPAVEYTPRSVSFN